MLFVTFSYKIKYVVRSIICWNFCFIYAQYSFCLTSHYRQFSFVPFCVEPNFRFLPCLIILWGLGKAGELLTIWNAGEHFNGCQRFMHKSTELFSPNSAKYMFVKIKLLLFSVESFQFIHRALHCFVLLRRFYIYCVYFIKFIHRVHESKWINH